MLARLLCPVLTLLPLAQNGVAVFDGSGGSVRIANSPAVTPAEITLECWVRAPASAGRLINLGDGLRGTTDRAYDLSVTSDQFIGWLYFQGADAVSLRSPVIPDSWTHLAVTFDSSAGLARLFVDGEQADSSTTMTTGAPLAGASIRQATMPLVLGRNNGFSAWDLDGELDQVRLWSRPLSGSELRCLANETIDATSMASYPDLIDVWNLDGDASSASGSRDGTILGTVVFADAELPSLLVSRFCTTSPNSVGPGAEISYSGSTSVLSNDFVLAASGMPADRFGVFFYSASTIQAPFGDGVRCVGSPLRRTPTVVTDATGSASRAIDVSAANVPIAAGTEWFFQLMYRDPGGPGGTNFNTSDGLRAEFCP